MGNENISKFMASSSKHIANLNRALKGIKLATFIDFIRSDHCSLIFTSNKVASPSDLNVVKYHIKNISLVDINNVWSAHLSQSKSYLKILGIPYFIEGTNMPIDSSVIEIIIKSTHIFNNICITFKPWVVKVLPKSDMAIIWIDIWDSQSSMSAKTLINHCFNIRKLHFHC